MTGNVIENLRNETIKYFSRSNKIHGQSEEFFSNNNKYRILKTVFKQDKADVNWFVAELEVFNSSNQLISTLILDDSDFFHAWIEKEDVNYLVFAERLCGGNSVLNLNSISLSSFADGTDGFICTEYYPSSDNKLLAAVGCYWGGPYFVMVYDISAIETLPWPVIAEINLDDDEDTKVYWNSEDIVIYKIVNNIKTLSREVQI